MIALLLVPLAFIIALKSMCSSWQLEQTFREPAAGQGAEGAQPPFVTPRAVVTREAWLGADCLGVFLQAVLSVPCLLQQEDLGQPQKRMC